jgi:hypothetical protein
MLALAAKRQQKSRLPETLIRLIAAAAVMSAHVIVAERQRARNPQGILDELRAKIISSTLATHRFETTAATALPVRSIHDRRDYSW